MAKGGSGAGFGGPAPEPPLASPRLLGRFLDVQTPNLRVFSSQLGDLRVRFVLLKLFVGCQSVRRKFFFVAPTNFWVKDVCRHFPENFFQNRAS